MTEHVILDEQPTDELAIAQAALARVLELASAWQARGRSDITYADAICCADNRWLPQAGDSDAADRLREAGQDWIHRATLIRRAVEGTLPELPQVPELPVAPRPDDLRVTIEALVAEAEGMHGDWHAAFWGNGLRDDEVERYSCVSVADLRRALDENADNAVTSPTTDPVLEAPPDKRRTSR